MELRIKYNTHVELREQLAEMGFTYTLGVPEVSGLAVATGAMTGAAGAVQAPIAPIAPVTPIAPTAPIAPVMPVGGGGVTREQIQIAAANWASQDPKKANAEMRIIMTKLGLGDDPTISRIADNQLEWFAGELRSLGAVI